MSQREVNAPPLPVKSPITRRAFLWTMPMGARVRMSYSMRKSFCTLSSDTPVNSHCACGPVRLHSSAAVSHPFPGVVASGSGLSPSGGIGRGGCDDA